MAEWGEGLLLYILFLGLFFHGGTSRRVSFVAYLISVHGGTCTCGILLDIYIYISSNIDLQSFVTYLRYCYDGKDQLYIYIVSSFYDGEPVTSDV